VPKNSIVKYESALNADKYLVIAHGDASEVEKARLSMQQMSATAEVVAKA
jgi:hypothetical protein